MSSPEVACGFKYDSNHRVHGGVIHVTIPWRKKKPWPFLFPESIAKHLKIVKSATELFSIVPKAHYDNASADAERILKR